MIQPNYLQKGDTVAIVSTARKIASDQIIAAIKLLEKWGLNVVIGNTIGLEIHQFAGNDEARINDFQQMLKNPKVKAIWCARGGYGTVRLVDKLDFSAFKKHPKWIIGYSDITVLHSHIHNLGVETLHATMPINIVNNSKEALETLKKSLFGKNLSYEIPTSENNKLGSAAGEIVGGNLSVLYSLLGSKSSIKTDGKMLFIEDLDEYLYHVDRMMMQLEYKGLLKQLKGLVVGSMTKMKDNDIPWGKDALEIIEDAMKPYAIPLVFDFPAGHIPDNRALIFGSKVVLEVNKDKTKLVFE